MVLLQQHFIILVAPGYCADFVNQLQFIAFVNEIKKFDVKRDMGH